MEFSATGQAFGQPTLLDPNTPGATSSVGHPEVLGHSGDLNRVSKCLLFEGSLHSRARGDPGGLLEGNFQALFFKGFKQRPGNSQPFGGNLVWAAPTEVHRKVINPSVRSINRSLIENLDASWPQRHLAQCHRYWAASEDTSAGVCWRASEAIRRKKARASVGPHRSPKKQRGKGHRVGMLYKPVVSNRLIEAR